MTTDNRKRALALMTAISMGVGHLAIVGVISLPAQAQASATVTVWGDTGGVTLIEIPDVDPDPDPDPRDDQPGDTPSEDTSVDTTKEAKPCASSRIASCSGSSGTYTATDPERALKTIPVQNTKQTPDEAKRTYEQNTGASWNALTAKEQEYLRNMPSLMVYPDGSKHVNMPETNSIPTMLTGDNLALFEANIGSTAPYGPSYRGLLQGIGLTDLAQNFNENEAREFVICHELAHAISPGHGHSNVRNSASFFNAAGLPASTDGVALMLMAAKSSNNPASKGYNSELSALASKAGAGSVAGASSPEKDC